MTIIDYQHPKVVFEPVPSRWRVENRIRDDKWVGDQCFPTLEAATAYAQEMTNNDLDGAYRVVDTQPDMTTPRLSGPCSHGDHHYCLGPHMILPCNCPCHATEHAHPEPEGTLNQAGFSINPY